MSTLTLSDYLQDEQIASLLQLTSDEPEAADAVFGLRAERRNKPTIIADAWSTMATIIIKDAAGRIVAELPEMGETL